MYLLDVVLMIVGVAGLIVCPKSTSFIWFLVVSIGILAMSMYSAQSLHYAYPLETMGAATFIITPLGYAGESIMPLFNGWCLSNFEGAMGYRVMFTGFIVLLAIGGICLVLFRKHTVERRAELDVLRKAKKSSDN